MTRPLRTRRRRRLLVAIAGVLLAALAGAGCSGNSRVSVGGSVHKSSGGSWGHGLSIGIQSHRVRQ